MSAARSLPIALELIACLVCVGCSSSDAPSPAGRGQLQGALEPGPVEWCNGQDDDGDGQTDENGECVQGSEGACATACGGTGSRTCGEACTWSSCRPPEEVCDGEDNDCDGLVDDGFECPAGSSGSCPLAGGGEGAGLCGSDCRWLSCVPILGEICNGKDDDGDGQTDEERVCRSRPEVCNFRDDNGDGRTDEGLAYGFIHGPIEVPSGAPFSTPREAICSSNRVVVRSERRTIQIDQYLQMFSPDGRRLNDQQWACAGEARMAWIGDEFLVACVYTSYPVYQAVLTIFGSDGMRRIGPIVVSEPGENIIISTDWPFDTSFSKEGWDMSADDSGIALLYGVFPSGSPDQVEYRVRTFNLELEQQGPVTVLPLAHSGASIRIRGDGAGGWVIFHVADETAQGGPWGITAYPFDPETGATGEGRLLAPYRYQIGEIRSFDDGWALLHEIMALYLYDRDWKMRGHSTALLHTIDPWSFLDVVAGRIFLSADSHQLDIFSLDSRLEATSDISLGRDQERATGQRRAACVLPDGRFIEVMGLGYSREPTQHATSRLVAVIGCPEP